MAELVEADDDSLTLRSARPRTGRALTSDPSPPAPQSGNAAAAPVTPQPPHSPNPAPTVPMAQPPATSPKPPRMPEPPPSETPGSAQPPNDDHDERLRGHIVSPAPTTERLQAIQRLVADQTGEALPNFEAHVLQAIPVQAGGLYPISDVWYIEPGLDAPDRLRVHIAQFAREIAEEAGQAERIETIDDGIGFLCDIGALSTDPPAMPLIARATLTAARPQCGYRPAAAAPTALDNLRLTDALGPLLQGWKNGDKRRPAPERQRLVKLFRLLGSRAGCWS